MPETSIFSFYCNLDLDKSEILLFGEVVKEVLYLLSPTVISDSIDILITLVTVSPSIDSIPNILGRIVVQTQKVKGTYIKECEHSVMYHLSHMYVYIFVLCAVCDSALKRFYMYDCIILSYTMMIT